MKSLLRNPGAVIGVVLFLASLFMAISPTNAQTHKVTLVLDYIVSGIHAPYFVAVGKGFYKDAGLEVEVMRGTGSSDTVKKVAAKQVTFGICDFGTLVTLNIREKTPTKAVAAVYGKSANGMMFLKESGIKVPKDIEGRVMGRSAAGATVNMLPAFFKVNNIDRSKIKEVVLEPSTRLAMLLSRKVDIDTEQPILRSKYQKAADVAGEKVTVMTMFFSDFGLNAYGNVIAAHDDLIRDNPELVRRFVQATIKGLSYAFEHPEEAISILVNINPVINEEGALGELLAIRDTWTEGERKSGLGVMAPEKTRASVDNITSALGLARPASLEAVYIDKFMK